MIFVRLAGGNVSYAFRSHSTAPELPSITTTAFASTAGSRDSAELEALGGAPAAGTTRSTRGAWVGAGVGVAVGSGVGVAVGGNGVAVGGTAVAVAVGVAVGGSSVAVATATVSGTVVEVTAVVSASPPLPAISAEAVAAARHPEPNTTTATPSAAIRKNLLPICLFLRRAAASRREMFRANAT
ncbi:MAG TPA: hypothetical protein PKD27_10425 [Tepidiformaceae bacterium]|nr:hypothetical protein [Tepidiformaceae bacterium]